MSYRPQIYLDTEAEAEKRLGEQARERLRSYDVPYPEGVVEKAYAVHRRRIELVELRMERKARKERTKARYLETKGEDIKASHLYLQSAVTRFGKGAFTTVTSLTLPHRWIESVTGTYEAVTQPVKTIKKTELRLRRDPYVTFEVAGAVATSYGLSKVLQYGRTRVERLRTAKFLEKYPAEKFLPAETELHLDYPQQITRKGFTLVKEVEPTRELGEGFLSKYLIKKGAYDQLVKRVTPEGRVSYRLKPTYDTAHLPALRLRTPTLTQPVKGRVSLTTVGLTTIGLREKVIERGKRRLTVENVMATSQKGIRATRLREKEMFVTREIPKAGETPITKPWQYPKEHERPMPITGLGFQQIQYPRRRQKQQPLPSTTFDIPVTDIKPVKEKPLKKQKRLLVEDFMKKPKKLKPFGKLAEIRLRPVRRPRL
jgi:hypothetical protein